MGLKLKQLAERLNCELKGDGGVRIERVAPIERAGAGDITFLSNPKYLQYARKTKASAIIVAPQMSRLNGNLLICGNPYLAFARTVGILMGDAHTVQPGRHPTAVVADDVRVGENVEIGPHVTVESGAVLGDNVALMSNVYIGPNVEVGEGTIVHPNAAIYRRVRIGKRCVVHSNVTIGSDGFGWAPNGRHYESIPQVGTTVIGDDVSIGAGSVINRGALGDTRIGSGTKIDSLVIISHNVEVGEDCLFVSQVGISGSVKIGNHVTFGGQVGVSGHLKIGDNVQVAAQAGVTHDLAPNKAYLGAPARPINEMRKAFAAFNKLPELRRDIRHVQKRMSEISAMLERDVGAMTAGPRRE